MSDGRLKDRIAVARQTEAHSPFRAFELGVAMPILPNTVWSLLARETAIRSQVEMVIKGDRSYDPLAPPEWVVWETAPLAQELAVSEWPRVHLLASTDGEDTDWHVRLSDVELVPIAAGVADRARFISQRGRILENERGNRTGRRRHYSR